MRLLKILLWLTLSICLTWAVIIIFGPKTLTWAIEKYTFGTVIVDRVNISPRLEVNIPLVEVSGLDTNNAGAVSGVLRGVSIDWSYKDGFEIIASVGSAQIDGGGVVGGSNLKAKPRSLIDWSEIRFSITFESVLTDALEFANGKVTAGLLSKPIQLRDIAIEVAQLGVKLPEESLTLEGVDVAISQLVLGQSIANQQFEFSMRLPSGIASKGLRAAILSIDGNLLNGTAAFILTGDDLNVPGRGASLERVTLSSAYDIAERSIGKNWDVEAQGIAFESPYIEVSSYNGTTEIIADRVSHIGAGKLKKLILKTPDTFLGELADGAFDLKLTTSQASEPGLSKVDLNASLTLEEDMQTTLDISAAVVAGNISDCISKSCNIANVDANYRINILGEILEGASVCAFEPCRSDNYQHQIETKDTEAFLSKIAQIGIFNPLVAPVLYMELRRGTPTGRGHTREF